MKPRRSSAKRSPRLVGFWWAMCALPALTGAALATCVRHADIRDEKESDLIDNTPQIDAGDIPDLDSGIETDAYPACIDRPLGDCKGTTDFPCGFDTWLTKTAQGCQEMTGCKTNGWLEVRMGPGGCVVGIGMDEPNDEILECLLGVFGSVRCTCLAVEGTYFFGYGNAGVCAE